MELTVIIPTRNRRELLVETLRRLAEQSGEVPFEVIVIDDGSRDDSPAAVRDLAERGILELRLIEQESRGPAVARNRALAAARAPVCLFLNDDTFPRPDLVERHARFHQDRPESEAALLGQVALAPDPRPTPFMRWLAEQQFDFHAIEDPGDVRGGRFYTSNVSAKVEFLRAAGGFDESFRQAAHEDIELGLRLEKRGMQLRYDAAAVVEHCHPLDLEAAVTRFKGVGGSLAALAERHPEFPVPRRPDARHRVKASLLTALTAARVRTPPLKREVWRFLCHEALREGFWSAVEGSTGRRAPESQLRIGAQLRRQAVRDRDARVPDEEVGAAGRG